MKKGLIHKPCLGIPVKIRRFPCFDIRRKQNEHTFLDNVLGNVPIYSFVSTRGDKSSDPKDLGLDAPGNRTSDSGPTVGPFHKKSQLR